VKSGKKRKSERSSSSELDGSLNTRKAIPDKVTKSSNPILKGSKGSSGNVITAASSKQTSSKAPGSKSGRRKVSAATLVTTSSSKQKGSGDHPATTTKPKSSKKKMESSDEDEDELESDQASAKEEDTLGAELHAKSGAKVKNAKATGKREVASSAEAEADARDQQDKPLP